MRYVSRFWRRVLVPGRGTSRTATHFYRETTEAISQAGAAAPSSTSTEQSFTIEPSQTPGITGQVRFRRQRREVMERKSKKPSPALVPCTCTASIGDMDPSLELARSQPDRGGGRIARPRRGNIIRRRIRLGSAPELMGLATAFRFLPCARNLGLAEKAG